MTFTEFCIKAGVTPDKMDNETYIYWRIKYQEWKEKSYG